MGGYHGPHATRPRARKARGDPDRLLRGQRARTPRIRFRHPGQGGRGDRTPEDLRTRGADLEAGDLEARIERSAPARYTMLAGGATILSAKPAGALNTPEIWSLDRLYQGRLSLLRNAAEAGPAGEEVTIRITGGLTNRNYEATFDPGDEGSLPVAFFLLYLTVALRRKAYLTTGLGRVDPS